MNKLSNKEYNFIYEKVPRICVDIIIKSNKKVLMIKREIQPYKNMWSIPGGGIQFRESFEKAIQRIAMNELGQKVLIHKQVGSIEFLRERKEGTRRHSISITFLCSLTKKNSTFKYFDGSEKNLHPDHKLFIISKLKK